MQTARNVPAVKNMAEEAIRYLIFAEMKKDKIQSTSDKRKKIGIPRRTIISRNSTNLQEDVCGAKNASGKNVGNAIESSMQMTSPIAEAKRIFP